MAIKFLTTLLKSVRIEQKQFTVSIILVNAGKIQLEIEMWRSFHERRPFVKNEDFDTVLKLLILE